MLTLFIDTFNNRLVKGEASTESFVLPRLVQGDTVPMKLVFLEPQTNLAVPYTVLDLTNISIRVGIGNPTGTQGGPTPLAFSTDWTVDDAGQFATGKLNLNTLEIAAAIGSAARTGSQLEVELNRNGEFDTVYQGPITLFAEVMEGSTGQPSILPSGGTQSGSNFLLPAGQTITLVSPDGTKGIILGCNNDGSFQTDSITF